MSFGLIREAKDTVAISKDGFYVKDNNKIFLEKSKDHPIYEKHLDYSVTFADGKTVKTYKKNLDENCIVEVRDEGTVDAVERLGKIYPHDAIGVLNFASAKSPGGGFLNGAVAQEECLCYCSDLYNMQLGQEYYEYNRNLKSKYYSDTMIISQTHFFKNSKFKLLDRPIECMVITCPAVNQRIAGSGTEVDNVMKNRMRKILDVFVYYKQEYLILGAFGCGVFGNNATTVAQIWRDLLYKEGYCKYFKYVSFSIIGNKNLKTFQEIFE